MTDISLKAMAKLKYFDVIVYRNSVQMENHFKLLLGNK